MYVTVQRFPYKSTLFLKGNTYHKIKFATNQNWKILGNFDFEELTVVLL